MKICLLPVVMLLVCSMVYAQHSGHIEGTIEVNTSENTLSAPSACSYQWYFNGMKLSLNTREIKVISSGTYEVEMTGIHGEMETASIAVGFNDDGELITIYILGDSTAANWSSGYYPQTGWGQVLKYFFSPRILIDNRALSARSAKSFYNDHWAEIRNLLKPGDFVFIQFGINDSKSDDTARYSEPFTTFQDYLTLFVKETQTRGAHPVLLTTVRRNRWNTTVPPTLYPSYHDYPVATRQLAGELDVPLIDLDQLAVPLMEGLRLTRQARPTKFIFRRWVQLIWPVWWWKPFQVLVTIRS
jgi:lysophospholipase L1-like esterase